MSVLRPALDSAAVHVWWIALDEIGDEALAVLSLEERARANRFRRNRDRARWMAARAALRQTLAGYSGTDAAELMFRTGDFGKPELVGTPIHFNLSHAGERAALAVATREVGIDLEPIDPGSDLAPLIAAGCTPDEAARLMALPEPRRGEAFLALWTLKEAYLKATGAGLSREPRSIAIDVGDGGRATVRDPQAETAAGWSLCGIDAGAGWTAALAVAGEAPVITCFPWPARAIRDR